MLSVGLDRLSQDPSLGPLVSELRGARVALLAHPASVTRELVHALEVLGALAIVPRVLFGPEHGWAGQAQDMIGVGDETHGGARVVSLYGEHYEDLSPRREHLDGIDVVVIDLQDIGARYYTFVWTAVLVARACRDAGVRVVVLDRPNPLGDAIEGRLQASGFLSFVGLERLPIRHGLTLGQIVAWRANLEGYAELITVVKAQGHRTAIGGAAHAPSWDRPFVMPSPNMPTYETALVYPGGCLLEGTNLSDGRGTTRPFELTGAPWLDGARLARALEATKLGGFIARPTAFEPTFHKHARMTCGGVQVHPTSDAFRPVATYVALIALAHSAHREHFAFRTETYEFVDDIPAFDLLTGSAVARERIVLGDDPRSIAEHVSEVGGEERALIEQARAATTRSF